MTSKTLVLIDGHALAYRQFFALERTRMQTSEGTSVWAVYGFFKAIFDLLKNVQPDAIAVSFDMGRKTFRTEAYSEYKANRQAMPDTLREQMSLLFEGVKAMGIPIYQLEGYEADDVIGTISHKACALGHEVLILTGDRDSFQLVEKSCKVKVLIPSKGELLEYDREKVFEKMSVWPEQIVDYKALCGDTSDNIPGVKGIGDKTAVKLLAEYETLDNVYANIENITSKSVKNKLEADKEMAYKSQFLATIDLNVPIEFDFEHTHLTMPNLDVLTDFLRKMEFKNFLKNLPVLLKPFNDGVVPEIDAGMLSPVKQVISGSKDSQLNLFSVAVEEEKPQETSVSSDYKYSTITSEEDLNKLVQKLKNVQAFAFDTETDSLDVLNANLVGVSIAINEQVNVENNQLNINKDNESNAEAYYIPTGHKIGKQLPLEVVLSSLKSVFENENIKKIAQNAKFDISVLKQFEIDVNGLMFDTMLASYVKNPAFKHGLKQQAYSFLKMEMAEIEELIGKGKSAITMADVEIDRAAKYACDDAKATLELAKFYTEKLNDEDKKLVYEIETPLCEVLADMELNGVSLDKDYLSGLSTEITEKLHAVEAKIYEFAGGEFNVNSPKQVGEVLFEKLELKGKKKTQTGYSTSAKVLESLKDEHPIVNLLLEQRHLAKLKSTYIDSLPELVNSKDNRIHTSFNQTITTTGRLSSSNPNLQNIPIRTEIGKRIRAAFVPEDKENSVLLSADYSQVELRLLAHYSEDEALIDAFCKGEDIHSLTASKVYGVPLEEVTKEMRYGAKAVNFGIIYGQTRFGLSEALGISNEEAKQFIEKYFETYPNIKKYMDETIDKAKETGFVSTLYDRKRYLGDELNSRNHMIREFAKRAAINAPLQGTASDLIKIAMIELSKKLKEKNLKSKMILQVHDELVLEVPKAELEEVTAIVKECMELGQPLKAPLVVDVEYSSNWMNEKIDESMAIEASI